MILNFETNQQFILLYGIIDLTVNDWTRSTFNTRQITNMLLPNISLKHSTPTLSFSLIQEQLIIIPAQEVPSHHHKKVQSDNMWADAFKPELFLI